MREIGGFLEFEKNSGHEYHKNCLALNSGRNCLRYLIRARKIKKIWLPRLLCSAISDTCKEEGVNIQYYTVNNQLKPFFPSVSEDEWIYLINYYGQYSEMDIISFCKKNRNVIIDNAQAFYTKPLVGVDTIYTCRKFLGVPDGGYLYTTSECEDELEQDESYDRIQFLAGRFERTAQDFYELYRENERLIDVLPLKHMSKTTHNLLRGVDYEKHIGIRERNFSCLHSHLEENNLLKINVPVGPYMYPYYVKDGVFLRKKLQDEKIYIPVLWPNVKEDLCATDTEYQLSDNILPIPCDQRYTVDDMNYIIKIIKRMEDL